VPKRKQKALEKIKSFCPIQKEAVLLYLINWHHNKNCLFWEGLEKAISWVEKAKQRNNSE